MWQNDGVPQDGKGGAALVARVKIGEWPRLAGSP